MDQDALEWVCRCHAAEQFRDWGTLDHMHRELETNPHLRAAVTAFEIDMRGKALDCPEHLGGVSSYYFSTDELKDSR